MDADIAQLVSAERITEAAELASTRAQSKLASELFERACDFRRAGQEALRSRDAARALLLSVIAGDAAVSDAAFAIVSKDRSVATRVASQLDQRGDFAWAARVHETTGNLAEAARAWERAGHAVFAAELHDKLGDPVQASKVLESAIRRDPNAFSHHVALGKLLQRYGKNDAAVRALQKVPEGAPERRDALGPLIHALNALGLSRAADEASAQLRALGGTEGEAPLSAAEPARRIYGRYDVIREVASTATSRVIECTDSVRGEHVAVKIFSGVDMRGTGRDALARFEREVTVLGSMNHPNIVPLRDYVPEGPAIVLAWMSGGTLETMLDSPIAPGRAVEIAQAVLSALGEAHRVGVLHRDIKPANVLFDDAGVTRLSDFGVAHIGDLSVTATAGIIGTLAYMSPEQREGRPATVQSDLFGVGALLYEMLTGERLDLSAQTRTLPSAAHRDLDARHDDLVMRFVAGNPDARPPDAFAARRELGALKWPSSIERAAPRRPKADAETEREDARVQVGIGNKAIDRWAGRSILRIPLSDEAVSRAAGFARAGHRVLQTVLRVDREENTLWLDDPHGTLLDRALTGAEAQALRIAIDALHGEGIVHGHVDRAHVLCTDAKELVLLFASTREVTATADTDFAQLARLTS